jgi:3'(2'), 5'-bisphosphate nucleotidase
VTHIRILSLTKDEIAQMFVAIALLAGRQIMDVYERGCSGWLKSDGSPVTEADELAERTILAELAVVAPGVPVVSEEAAAQGKCPAIGSTFILVDPLDGTREFLSRNGEFTVNIALVRDGAPVCGVIFAPATGRLWFSGETAYATNVAGGKLPAPAHWRRLQTRKPPASGLVALVSRSHLDERSSSLLDTMKVYARGITGSSLKFGLIAQGDADVYPRFSPTMEWDIAAGDAILRAAGGGVVGEDAQLMVYGNHGANFRNGNFVAWGRVPVR